MEFTTIIIIAIFAICGFVLFWAIANGNNIKFKKREKKSKSKPAKDEKFKDVVPKEKPKKAIKQKISESVKEEKSGKKEVPSNKVVKVTKEDFKSNDLEVPKTLDDKKEEQAKITQEEFKFDFDNLNITGDPTTKLLGDINFNDPMTGGEQPLGLDGMNDDLFLPPTLNSGIDDMDLFKGGMQEDFYKFDDKLSALQLDDDFPYGFEEIESPKEKKPGQILNETMQDRFNQVFGENLSIEEPVKEVLVGNVLASSRSRTNRELRERRLKKVVTNSLADKD